MRVGRGRVVVAGTILFALAVLALPGQSVARGKAAATIDNLAGVLRMSDARKAALPDAIKCAAVAKYGLKRVALSQDFICQHNTNYKVQIPDELKPHRVRDQQQSGRCWIYSADRVLRSTLAQKGMKNPPETSTSFVNYYALHDEAMAVLIALASGKGGRHLKKLGMVRAAGEGGFQPWVVDIIKAHGIVPKSAMGSTKDAFNSDIYIDRLQTLLAAAGKAFEHAGKKGIEPQTDRRALFGRYQQEVEKLLDTTLGKPPERFTVEGKTYTPQTYASDYLKLGKDDLDFVYLTNKPTRGYGRRHKMVGFAGMRGFEAYNVTMNVLEAAVKKTVDAGQAVWVGVNVGNPYMARGRGGPKKAKGVMSLAAYNYGVFVPSEKISKGDRLKARIDTANHAMAVTGYDPAAKGKGVLKWKIENSWGSKANDKGHLHMYDDFFRQYVEEVAIPRSLVPQDVLAKLESRPLAKKPMVEDK